MANAAIWTKPLCRSIFAPVVRMWFAFGSQIETSYSKTWLPAFTPVIRARMRETSSWSSPTDFQRIILPMWWMIIWWVLAMCLGVRNGCYQLQSISPFMRHLNGPLPNMVCLVTDYSVNTVLVIRKGYTLSILKMWFFHWIIPFICLFIYRNFVGNLIGNYILISHYI